ncbi:NAD(P)/FAD-dependent oxidoreductase [Pseudomonas chlororaphis]|uniref:NAD(P)/FAD-dependent oxidoreductase n=1 Tax=Pseudomonas chlororaphis TaxID=587753 RepID=UPI00209AC267|nr:NAD(P)/FAD-dependent oxidoreductase [Pseudomonas chlororaphis]MCO7610670.1 NAD(P)/FAD-dependent oxidoreductase [Pseudomonas chlororaphis]
MSATARPQLERHFDVIVFGAGPAGSALAHRLAPRHSVLVLERGLPSPSSLAAEAWRIGESLPGAAAVLLRRQGLLERFLADGHALRGASVSVWESPQPVWFDALRDPNGPGWHLDRVRFDAMLRNAAGAAGTVFSTVAGGVQVLRECGQWHVRDERTGQSYTARAVVDATGRSSALCRRLGLRRQTQDRLLCVHARLPAQEKDQDRCTRTSADVDGWWYSVRLPSGDRVLAYHLDARDPALPALRHGQELLRYARRLPLLAPVLPGGVSFLATRVRPAGSVLLNTADGVPLPGFYAVGDSLLAFDPLSSQGLFHALASAESAAKAIEGEFAGDPRAGQDYFMQMREVQTRYCQHLAATYARPERYRERPFWVQRCAPLQAPAAQ